MSLFLSQLFSKENALLKKKRSRRKFVIRLFVFTGSPGKYVSLAETIEGFTKILNGELDDLPEQSFYLVGNITEALSKAASLK